MSLLIPWNRIADLTIRPRLFSGNQEGVLGGEDLATPRMGDRLAADVITTQLRQDAESRHLIATLFEATTADARIELRVPNASPLAVSDGLVAGAGQAGSTLLVRDLEADTAIPRGNFFSILHGGVHYLHMVRTQVIADAAGGASVPIWPMLRFITTDADVCHFVRPMIEGQLIGFDKGAAFARNQTKPISFTIQERK